MPAAAPDPPAPGAEARARARQREAALAAGASGLSTGLFYAPAKAAPTEEVIEIAKGLNAFGARHSTHMRDESDRVTESLEETFRIGREAAVPVIISHHKCSGRANHGRSVETLALIDKARAKQPIGLDAYPYVAGSTTLSRDMLSDASEVLIAWSEPKPEAAGRKLSEWAREMGVSEAEAVAALMPAGGIFFTMDEADARRILAYPHTMIGSDGLPHDVHPHPRLWGTFPRVLGHYVRDVGLFSLEEAVRKITSVTAPRFGLSGPGVLPK